MNECDILAGKTYPDPSYILRQELRNGDPPEKTGPSRSITPTLERHSVIETDTDQSGTYDFLQ